MIGLNLQIENMNTLPDGGPVRLYLEGKGARIGRKTGMDWILPDTTRHISGHHLDIIFNQEVYFAQDVSRNGTFMHGERQRMQSPRPIRSGDRFVVGQYVIRAELTEVEDRTIVNVGGAAGPTPQPDVPATPLSAEIDPAQPAPSLAQRVSPQPAPTPPPPLAQARPTTPEPEDAKTPQPVKGMQAPPTPGLQQPGGPPDKPAATGLTQQPDFRKLSGEKPKDEPEHPLGAKPAPVTRGPLSAPPNFGAPAEEKEADKPEAEQHVVTPARSIPTDTVVPDPPLSPAAVSAAAAAVPPARLPDTPPADPGPAAAPAAAPMAPQGPFSAEEFMRAFCEGAGIEGPSQAALPPADLARILGMCVRLGTNEMMQMLQERSAVKYFMSEEERTMMVSNGNNPMKFMPDPERAFETMFLQPKDGYMNGADSFANAFSDLKKHQAAVMSALQPALAEMIDGLDPADIETSVGKSRLGKSERKFWEEYSKRWKERASKGDNGMLDAFISAFARHYSNAIRNMDVL